ncbi:hypothetical protein [Gallibacterium anatis]|uniref:hypothetical protein n=1 Tax=Gallibacterium anatis TaxID=750 RepID=UPI0039FC6DBF
MNAEEKKIETREEDNWDHCCPRCFFIILILFIIVFHQWIIAEVTTPIRCKMLGDEGVKIYITLEEWQKLRGIKHLKPSESVEEYNKAVEDNIIVSYSDLDESVKSRYIEKIEFYNKEYLISTVNTKTKLVSYRLYEDFYDLYTEYYIVYDSVLEQVIGRSIDVSARFYLIRGLGIYNDYNCYSSFRGKRKESSNEIKLRLIIDKYNF